MCENTDNLLIGVEVIFTTEQACIKKHTVSDSDSEVSRISFKRLKYAFEAAYQTFN